MEQTDQFLRQGAHPDPLDPGYQPPNPETLPDRWRAALTSPEMAVYRASLLLYVIPMASERVHRHLPNGANGKQA